MNPNPNLNTFSWKPLHTMPGVSTFCTFYDDVRVPASSIVAGENEGWQLITTQLNFERAALGNLGALEPLFEKTLDWAVTTELDSGRVIRIPVRSDDEGAEWPAARPPLG